MLRRVALLLAVVAWPLAGAAATLVDAAKAADAQAVRTLLQKKADVNEAAPDGMTALHWAARNDDETIARALVRAGANVNAANRYGLTPLALAAENGRGPMVELLLAAGARPNVATPDGETPMMTAARTGSVAAIRALAARGADVNARDKWMGESALTWAAAENNADAVRALVEIGADVNARSTVLQFPEFKWTTSGMVSTALPRGGWTPLMHAARQGSLEAARVLAGASGVDLNVRDPDGTTALVVAIINAHYDLAALLLDRGADPNVADNTGVAALYSLVDMNTLAPMQGRPAPKLVDSITAVDLARKLLGNGAQPNARLTRPMIGRYHGSGDNSLGEGTTPFLRAAKAVDVPMMRVLLEGGADPALTKKDRTNAAMLVAAGLASGGYVRAAATTPVAATIEALTLLVDHGVDVRAFNTGGETALHIAADRGLEPVARFLVEHGARTGVTDKRGRTPLDMALGVGSAPGARGAVPNRESTVAYLRTVTGSVPPPLRQ